MLLSYLSVYYAYLDFVSGQLYFSDLFFIPVLMLYTAASLGGTYGAGGGTQRRRRRQERHQEGPGTASPAGEKEEAATKEEEIASGAATPEDGACRGFTKPGKP